YPRKVCVRRLVSRRAQILKMEPLAASSIQSSRLPVCTHIYPKGRHCRQAVLNADALYCAIHAPQHRTSIAALAAKLNGISAFEAIPRFLIGVLNLLAQGQIPPRRAAVFTYIANSIRQAAREEDRVASQEPSTYRIELGELDKNRQAEADEKAIDEPELAHRH